MSASYTFLPWLRRGLGNKINQKEDGPPTTGRPVVDVSLKLSGRDGGLLHSHTKYVAMLGPGDVLGINPNAVIKVMPPKDSSDFEPNYLPFIEFYDEDMPWRFSPVSHKNDKLSPWLLLLVLKEDEFVFETASASGLPIITLKSDILFPSLDQSWAWAHVQVNGELNASLTDQAVINDEVSNLLKTNPDLAYSRLLSPRRLDANTRYTAFLVPNFKAGAKAGLGDDKPYDGISTQTKTELTKDSRHPVYYSWSFATSTGGDFEALARRIQPYNAAELSIPTLDISDLISESGEDPGNVAPLQFSSALMPPGYQDRPWPSTADTPAVKSRNHLRSLVNSNVPDLNLLTDDPVVNLPPMYGQWHAGVNKLLPDSTESGNNSSASSASSQSTQFFLKKGASTWVTDPAKPWLYTLNLDPRFRAIASLGTEVVQTHQEKFMDDAWEQVNAILEANQLLRQGQLAIEVNKKILEKHITPRSETERYAVTSIVHKKMMSTNTSETVARQSQNAKVSPAGFDAGMKKINRPGGKVAPKAASQMNSSVTSIEFREKLLSDLDSAVKPDVSGAVRRPAVFEVANAAGLAINTPSVEEDFIQEKINSYLIQPTGQPWQTENLTTSANHIENELKPEQTLGQRILRRTPIKSTTLSEVKPIMAAPDLPYPMNEYLKSLSGEYLIPGLSKFPNNVVALLEPNRPFIEAFMAGLNHEMARELLWREYPTDQRGSYFRQFWNARDFINTSKQPAPELTDIAFMHTWNGALGSHAPALSQAPGLVLVFRGDLFRKFPNTILFAQKGEYFIDPIDKKRKRRLLENGEVKFPLNKSLIEPDINIVGFDLSPDAADGNKADAGWFFVFQERLGEARFGIDDNDQASSPTNWDGLAWAHVDSTAGLNTDPLKDGISTFDDVVWGKNAAHMAFILYQAPVMLAIHASDFMPPKPPKGDTAVDIQLIYNPVG